jgi:crotonobetainyl-CoA:carnitine CoA-transferase CaiB-like acyl-CoA transferase
VLQRPEVAVDERFDTNAKRSANRIELKALIEELFRELDAAQVVALLDAAQIGNAAVNQVADVSAPSAAACPCSWVDVQTPAGTVPALKRPATTDSFDYRMGDVPALGQHTGDILRETRLRRRRSRHHWWPMAAV